MCYSSFKEMILLSWLTFRPSCEQGHFLGLYHTFEGNSCDPTNPNDRVSDTPQHISLADSVNCFTDPATWDTCPLLPGKDPVDNYMSEFRTAHVEYKMQ
jgi:Pregnancy-associated plasma protein-A